MIRVLRANKLLKNKSIEIELEDYIIDKLKVQNISTYLEVSSIFNTCNLVKVISDYIQRCFTMVVETDNFLELDFKQVDKILSSSKLSICTEVEIFHAANSWLGHKIFERKKHAVELLLNVRFPLLSESVTTSILGERHDLKTCSFFHKNSDCCVLINEVLKNKNEFYKNKSISYYTNRYCDSSNFNILFCNGVYLKRNEFHNHVYKTKVKNLENVQLFFETPKLVLDAFFIKGKFYFLGLTTEDKITRTQYFFIYKYTPFLKTWKVLLLQEGPQYREKYCHCAFMDSIFIMGGYFNMNVDDHTDACIEMNVVDESCREVARMNQSKLASACAVFQGKVVVSGGFQGEHFNYFNTVESYDHAADSWSHMPKMVYGRSYHNLIAVSNKLYAVGDITGTFEAYDSLCGKFSTLKRPSVQLMNHNFVTKAVPIGSRILFFNYETEKVVSYNMEEHKWSEESKRILRSYSKFVCLKTPYA